MNSENRNTMSEIAWLCAGGIILLINRATPQTAMIVAAIIILNGFFFVYQSIEIHKLLNLISIFFTSLLAQQLLIQNRLATESYSLFFQIILGISATTLYLLFWQLFLSNLYKIKSRWTHLLILLPVGPMILLSTRFDLYPALNLFFQVCTILSLRHLWFFVSYFLETKSRNGNFKISDSLIPFWNPGFMPIQIPMENYSTNREDSIKSGVRILIYALFIEITLSLFKALGNRNTLMEAIATFDSYGSFNVTGREPYFFYYKIDIFSLFEKWFLVIGGFTYYILRFIQAMALIVGAGRLCGFPLLRCIYKPFDSRSFYEVLSRSNYYYVELITSAFMNPLIGTLSHVSLRLRISVSAFLSIFFFGLLYHFLKFPLLLIANASDYFFRLISYTPYFFLIALGAAISIYCSLQTTKLSNNRNWFHWMRNAFYFVIYAVIFSFAGTDYFAVSGLDHAHFTLSLFTLDYF